MQDAEVPYLLDLQLFLSRRLVIGQETDAASANYAEDVVCGALPQEGLGTNCEWVAKQIEENADLTALRTVAAKGEKLYTKTRNAASIESIKRAKEVLGRHSIAELNPLFAKAGDTKLLSDREDLLARLQKYRPLETVFEIGKRGVTDQTVDLIRKARSRLETRRYQTPKDTEKSLNTFHSRSSETSEKEDANLEQNHGLKEDSGEALPNVEMESASEDELEITFSQADSKTHKGPSPWQESEHFMSYKPRFSNFAEDKAYGVHSGSSSNARPGSDFLVQAQDATLDLINDELKGFGLPNRPQMRWDKRSKKYVSQANDEDGSRGAKMVKGESGLKIAASLRSGRFEAWKKSNQIERVPRVGEEEAVNKHRSIAEPRRFKHRLDRAPKDADKFRDDFYKQKKKVAKAKENRIGKFKDGNGKNELRSIDDIRKQRKMKERKRLRTGRPSKKK